MRELRNVVHRAAVLAEGAEVRRSDLPGWSAPPSPSPRRASEKGAAADRAAAHGTRLLDAVIEHHIRGVLRAVGGNKSRAAEVLGIPRTSLYHKLRKYGIGPEAPGN